MTPRSGLRVRMEHVRRGLASLLLALLASFAAGVSGVAAQPAADHGQARPAAVAVPAMGRPPLLADDPGDPTATPRPGPEVGVPPCPAASPSVHSADRRGHHTSLPTPAEEVCALPSPLPTVVVQSPPSPSIPPTGAPAHSASPRPAAAAAAAPPPPSTPRPRAVPEPLPILPPLWLTPSVVPVPKTYGAEVAPTSVLVLGFGSVALASAVMTLRLLRRGR